MIFDGEESDRFGGVADLGGDLIGAILKVVERNLHGQ
jgi:hypothetical protein